MTVQQKDFVDRLVVYWNELREIGKDEIVHFEDNAGNVFLIVNRPDWPIVQLDKSMMMKLLDYSDVVMLDDLVKAPEMLPKLAAEFEVICERQAFANEKLSGQNVH